MPHQHPSSASGAANEDRPDRSEARTQALLEAMLAQTSDALALIDPREDRTVAFNPKAWQMLGYSREAFAKLRPCDLPADADAASVAMALKRAMQGETLQFEALHRRADGGNELQAVTLRAVDVDGRTLVAMVTRPALGGQAHDQHMRRLNQAYAVLSAVGQAILDIREPGPLFAQVCGIAVAVGGFRLAWVGELDDATRLVRPVAQCGHSEGYVEALHLPADSSMGTTAAALRSGQPQLCSDIAHDPRMAPWREAALARGYGAVATFAISTGGVRRHCLVVYAVAANHFDEQLMQLYGRLSQHLGFALEFIAAEQAQRHEQRFRQQLVESVAGVFFAVDADGCLVLWNQRLEEVSQYTKSELTGRPVMDLLRGSERTLMAVRLRAVLASTDATAETQVEASLVARDGEPLPCLFVLRRIGLDGKPLVVCTGIDIGDRVRSAQELARYHQHLEELVATRTAELEAANGRMHREDRRLRAMLSLSQKASTLSERQLFELGVAELARLTSSKAASLHAVDDAEQAFEVQAWLPTPEGRAGEPPPDAEGLWHRALQRRAVARRVPLEPASSSRDLCVPIFEGRQVRLVACVGQRTVPYEATDERDLVLIGGDLWRIIRRRRIEIALEAAKRAADAASQAKSAFLANMSHEIRTPMNAIIGFAHLIKRDPLSPRQVDHLGRIGEAGQHLLRLINDVLDFSKIEAHKVALEPTDFVLRDSVERVMAMVADQARSKGVGMQLAMPGCPPRLRADRLRLEQVLLNLVGNAVKFTEQGLVTVRVSPLPAAHGMGDGRPPARLRFEVQDTGIGMASEQVPQLFEPFEQADSSTTRRFGGTGLGLAICKRLVDLMQGRIGVASTLGQGSLFWFELPMANAAEPLLLPRQPALLHAPKPARGLDGARVLLAEDNLVNQEVACDLLQSMGLVVDLADNGEQAVQLASEGRHDLILLDMQMPVMDGLQAAAAMRALPAPHRVPIVAMTANAFDDDRALCLAAGMDDFLAKPVEPDTLRRCLERWLCTPPAATPAATAAGGAASDQDAPERAQLVALPGLAVAQGLARVNGHWRLYWRALGLFAGHHAADPPRLLALAQTRQTLALKDLSHALGGAAATLGAMALHQQARKLERAIDDPPGAALTAQALTALATPVADQLQALIDGLAPLLAAVNAGCPPAQTTTQATAQATAQTAAQTPAHAPAPIPASASASALLPLQAQASANAGAEAPTTAPLLPTAWPATPAGRPAAEASAPFARSAELLACLLRLQPLLSSHDTAASALLENSSPLLQAAMGPLADTLVAQVQAFNFEDARRSHALALQRAQALAAPRG